MENDFIQHYQYIISALVGFTGVIVTLLVNAKLARIQRLDEHQHDCDTLRAALIEELKINRDSFQHNLKDKPTMKENKDAFVPTVLMNDAYKAFIHKIGLLSQDEVHKVMNAYLTIRQYRDNLFLIGVPMTMSDHHVKVPSENTPLLFDGMGQIIPLITDVIETIEKSSEASKSCANNCIFSCKN